MSDDYSTELCERIALVRERIALAERRYGRSPGSVSLLAASKAQSMEKIQVAVECGQCLFGENYAQEAEAKVNRLPELQWHYIGPLQANKTRKVAGLFAWVHSVDRLKIAARLNQHRAETGLRLDICAQVNISREPGKAGAAVEDLVELADEIASMENLRLRGLMAIPQATSDFDQQRRGFADVRAALDQLQHRGHPLDTLSMGMSNDLEAAIAEGATIVRVGSAIFGVRE